MDPVYIDVLLPMTAQALDDEVGEALESTESPVKAGEKVYKKNKISLALVTATRRQAYRRTDARKEAGDWLIAEAGVEEFEDIEWETLPRETIVSWNIMWQAGDIIGALVPELCKGWEPPETLLGWADVTDMIFRDALITAHQLNPQWALESMLHTEPEGNATPDSQNNGESGTSDSESG